MAERAEPVPGRRRTRPRLVSDQARAWLSIAVGFVLLFVGGVVAGFIVARHGGDAATFRSYRAVVISYFGYWIAYCLCYMLITYLVFRRVPADRLRSWLRESERAHRRRRIVEFLSSGGGPAGAVGFATVALAAVALVAVSESLRGDLATLLLAILVVGVSWLLAVVSYAVHYAREYANRGGLIFPGTDDEADRADEGSAPGDPDMSDFFYLAGQVATTFSSSDVEIVRRRMRRVVTGHTLVAFVFNTVIVALLVSLLLSNF